MRLEAAAVLVISLLSYWMTGGDVVMFLVLILVPDLSMLGFLAGNRTGAGIYNIAHWYAWPIAAIGWGVGGHQLVYLHVGLIWSAHIGFDRMIGAGLKYPEGFRYSHLGGFAAFTRSSPTTQQD